MLSRKPCERQNRLARCEAIWGAVVWRVVRLASRTSRSRLFDITISRGIIETGFRSAESRHCGPLCADQTRIPAERKKRGRNNSTLSALSLAIETVGKQTESRGFIGMYQSISNRHADFIRQRKRISIRFNRTFYPPCRTLRGFPTILQTISYIKEILEEKGCERELPYSREKDLRVLLSLPPRRTSKFLVQQQANCAHELVNTGRTKSAQLLERVIHCCCIN